ncbi:hypothetical protein GE061_002060 [Apolygus lucorum]|uniref:CCHC-type domain-containing protein n=1 Tax=Apolygus lucorum TaxID=248454 RepID=A0A8S9X6M8_APOLU|nr:hypothetical protein GE061_002060 [Apolygus lucorum]
MPTEPLHEKNLKGIPIKGYHFPIGPGTDEGLYNDLFEGDILYNPLDGKNAVADATLLWPRGAVIYKVDDDVGCPDSSQCDILMRAMDHYHTKSCIRFKEWSGEKNFIRIFFNMKESGDSGGSFGEFRLLLQQQLNAVQGQMESFCHSISQTIQRQTDRIVEELQSMRMQSEGDQGRADPRRNEHLRSTNSGTTTFKPSKFDGTEDWESYFIQFSAVANKNCWDDDTRAVALGAALNGAARDVLADIGPSAPYRTLVEALEVRFGHKRQEQRFMTLLMARTQLAKEDLATYHQAVKTLARKALPGSSASSECMVVHLFVKGIRDSSLREKVAIAGPKSMTEAAEVALRLEAALLTPPVTVRSGEIVDEQFTDDRANRATTTTQQLPNRRLYRDFRQPPTCWKCLQPGHLARWCPFLANQNYASAFNKQDLNTVNTLGENFDYKSVMMYDEYAFSKDGKSPTLQSKKGNEIGPIWKKAGLSDSDLKRLQKLYRCEDGYVYSSYENSGTTPGFLMSINFHKAESKESSLGCVRFWYLIQDDTIAFLKLSQSYLDKVTQLDNDPETTFELWYNDTSEGQWVHIAVPLYVTRPFRLIFESEFSEENTYGTIALDDIELLYRECTSEGISDTAEAETTDSSETSERPLVTTHPPSTARSLLRREGEGYNQILDGYLNL